jgi:hypothetical protein
MSAGIPLVGDERLVKVSTDRMGGRYPGLSGVQPADKCWFPQYGIAGVVYSITRRLSMADVAVSIGAFEPFTFLEFSFRETVDDKPLWGVKSYMTTLHHHKPVI